MSAYFSIDGTVYPAQSDTIVNFDKGLSIQNAPAKRVTKFGDGYGMHMPIGPTVRNLSASFSNRTRDEIDIIETYFTLLKGEPFYIYVRGESIRVVVLGFNKNYQNGEIYSLTANLKEVFVYDIYEMLSNQTAAALFDIDDITSLRVGTDGSGGVPAEGDPVGLMMDVSGTGGKTMATYLEGATELVTNGTFDSNTTGWTAASGATLSILSEQLRVTCTAPDTTGLAYQSFPTVVGEWYEGTITKVSQDANSAWGFSTTASSARDLATFTTTDTGTATAIFQATSTTSYVQLWGFGDGVSDGTTVYDNVSVKALPGYVATAPSDAARPTLQQDAGSGKYYLDFDGTDDTFVLDATDFASSTNATLYKTFRGTSTDTTQIMFGAQAGPYVLAAQTGSTNTTLSSSVGTPTYREDGAAVSYTNRGTLFTALIDNTDHTIGAEDVDLSANSIWGIVGFYIGGEYSTTWDSTGRLYAWAAVDTKLSVRNRNILERWMLGKKT